MKRLFLSMLVALMALASWAVNNDQYTIIVSLDGFRWDYCEAYNTPFLNSMAEKGVKAVMSPSFPSKTFPNHYTLATGLVPDHHGIIANSFRIRSTGKKYSLGNAETRSDTRNYGGDLCKTRSFKAFECHDKGGGSRQRCCAAFVPERTAAFRRL